ncbi:MAG: hypothetical protein JWQ25_1106 [Daejeonella sp.]|nr:hypothetical protein [Daejeonella sp.]
MRQFLLNTKTVLALIISSIVILLLVIIMAYIKTSIFSSKTEMNEDVMVEKIVSMGKLELVKYAMKDVIEKKEIRTFLPDKRILFVAVGEVTGCVDLTKVKKSDIDLKADSITIFLPKPEICYVKLDHQKSRVYDISGSWFPLDTKNLVEGIYKVAEQQILNNAQQMGILKKTEENAELIFKPFLENITDKKVTVKFR